MVQQSVRKGDTRLISTVNVAMCIKDQQIYILKISVLSDLLVHRIENNVGVSAKSFLSPDLHWIQYKFFLLSK